MLLLIGSVLVAQEDCINGIDDDNDGLIDLNDDDCNCDQSTITLDAVGSICDEELVLSIDQPDANFFQWYKDGIALVGETGPELTAQGSIDQEGIFQVMFETDLECHLSVPYEAEYLKIVHLGDHHICQGDTVFFAGLALTFTGTFEETVPGMESCDSMTFISVIVQDPLPGYVEGQICDGQIFSHDGVDYDTPGLYDVETVTTIGCDSTYTVNVLEGELETLNVEASICPGDTYSDYGITADEPGTYDAIIENPSGCDTEVTIVITEDIQPSLNIAEIICDGETYSDYNLNETESGSYETYIEAAQGCDTLVTIDLTVEEIPTTTYQASICSGDTFILHDIEETESGTYTTSVDFGGNCDSLITVELLVSETIELDLVRTICEGEVYDNHGIFADETGNYSNSITNSNGCDSIITLDLFVATPSESFLTETICPNTYFDLHDIHENTTGSYETLIENANGCDSTIYVDLTVLEEAAEEVFYSICEGDVLSLNGEEYTQDGVYQNQLLSQAGCDSILTINLSVDLQPTAFKEAFICEGEIYEYGDFVEDKEGLYEISIENEDSCDSLVSISLVVIEPAEGVNLDYYHTVSYGNPIDIEPEFMGSGVTDITWTNEEGEEIGRGPKLENFMTLEDMNIALHGTDANGCPVEARAIIDVSIEVDIFIPSIFTPDGDGNNDTFQVYGGPTVSQLKEIHIYNRWGELMHSAKNVPATDEYIGWDGMHLGKPAIAGAYAYIAVFDVVTGDEKIVKGTVTLVY